MKRVLVCGGRDFADRERVFRALDALRQRRGVAEVIHGGARGADRLAGAWADARGVPCLVFMAKWDEDGRRAGPIRNQRMLDEGRPDAVVAFPGGPGTADMVARARRAGLPIWRPFGGE